MVDLRFIIIVIGLILLILGIYFNTTAYLETKNQQHLYVLGICVIFLALGILTLLREYFKEEEDEIPMLSDITDEELE